MTLVAGIDESDHSFYARQWALQHFFPASQPQQYRLIVVTAKPFAASAVGLAGPGTRTSRYCVFCSHSRRRGRSPFPSERLIDWEPYVLCRGFDDL